MKTSILYFKVVFITTLSVLLACCGGDSDNTSATEMNNQENSASMSITDVAASNPDFSTLVTALQATGLDQVLANLDNTFTVFAPTNAAFDKLPDGTLASLLNDTEALSNILLYHVIADAEIDSVAALTSAGSTISMANSSEASLATVANDLYINLAMVTDVDIQADNGVIHVIDSVILPPSDPGTTTLNVVDVAVADERFSTLVTALSAANLVEALSNPDANFTVFAPTNDAFDLLGDETITALLNDIPALTEILQLHVVNGDMAVDFVTALSLSGNMVETLGGEMIDIEISNGQLTIGGATVIIEDIHTTNGIIHVIDKVITE